MLYIKDGVKLTGLKPQMLVALNIAEWAFMKRSYDTILTSANDGKHMENSKHYKGFAIDLRIKHILDKEELKKIYEDIKQACNKSFDVILEKTHIHIEYNE